MKEIPREILRQLGDNRFLAMTGAKGIIGGDRVLCMQLPGSLTKKRGNSFQVHLNGRDTYDLEFAKITTAGIKTIERRTDIYCEDLKSSFVEMTGLLVSLR